jgi:hypothetical protein
MYKYFNKLIYETEQISKGHVNVLELIVKKIKVQQQVQLIISFL